MAPKRGGRGRVFVVAAHPGGDGGDDGQVVDRGAHVDTGDVGPAQALDVAGEGQQLGRALIGVVERLAFAQDHRLGPAVGDVGQRVLQRHAAGEPAGLLNGLAERRVGHPAHATQSAAEGRVVNGDGGGETGGPVVAQHQLLTEGSMGARDGHIGCRCRVLSAHSVKRHADHAPSQHPTAGTRGKRRVIVWPHATEGPQKVV